MSNRMKYKKKKKKKKDFTPWFDGEVKPLKIGVYQLKVSYMISYSYWNGSVWSYYAHNIQAALRDSKYTSKIQNRKWRGLNKEFKNA